MLARKDQVVKQNNDGILYLFKKNKITFFHGRGSFVKTDATGYEIKVAGAAEESISGKHIIVATGSNARALPGTPFDEENILSNDGALRIGAVPKKLGLIGSGVIGLEMGSVWRRLGAEVTVLEALPTFLGAVDEQIAKEAKKAFDKQKLKIELGVKVGEIKSSKKGVSVAWTNAKGEAQTLEVDKLIVSIGRVPNTIGLNAEAVGLKLDERGAIAVDDDCKTSLPNVWAIGDVVRGPMLAHKAEEEGVAVAERIAGQHGHVNFNTVAVGDLHQPRDRVGRPDRATAQGRGPRLQGRYLPVPCERTCTCAGRHNGHGQVPGRCNDGRNPRRAHRGPAGQRADLRSRRGHGVQGERRRHRAHLPRAPVAVGSHEGSGTRRGQAHAELLIH